MRLIHADDLAALPRRSWLVDGEIEDGGLAVLFGQSGSKKSFLALDYALHIAQQDAVVYIAGEGSRGFEDRVASWTKIHKKPRGQLNFVFDDFNLLDVGQVTELIESIVELRPRLVIVDTLARAMVGASDSSDRDIGLVVFALRQIQRYTGAATLIVHHTVKDGSSVRGSSALLGAADTAMKLVSDRDGRVTLTPIKVKDGEPLQRAMRAVLVDRSLVLLPANMVIDLKVKGAAGLSESMIDLLKFANFSTNRDGFRHSDVVSGIEMGKNQISQGLAALVDQGYLDAEGDRTKTFRITPSGQGILNVAREEADSRTLKVCGKPVDVPDLEGRFTVPVAPRPAASRVEAEWNGDSRRRLMDNLRVSRGLAPVAEASENNGADLGYTQEEIEVDDNVDPF